jgi:hypothetical protein
MPVSHFKIIFWYISVQNVIYFVQKSQIASYNLKVASTSDRKQKPISGRNSGELSPEYARMATAKIQSHGLLITIR